MANLSSATGFDSNTSLGSHIPTGSIMIIGGSAYSANQENNIDDNGLQRHDRRRNFRSCKSY